MAFFTRVNVNVPVLPPDDLPPEGTSTMSMDTCSILHRRYVSEPISNESVSDATTRTNNIPSGNANVTTVARSGVVGGTASNETSAGIVGSSEDRLANGGTSSKKSVNSKGRPSEQSLRATENGQKEDSKSSEENSNAGEPKRYEYVVDRVLGVEV